ncbi:MAG: hypothetical protein RBU23_02950 [Candidatus Auribacterota bacterium]|jgi:NAD/NADP transhydrogenase beta subunit|nr:hypothetical protein [Candidatus Auribacterota bacterium]
MKKLIASTVIAIAFIPVMLTGCGEKKQDSASAAIEKSKEFQTVEQKANYLIGQAEKFYKANEYKEAVTTAQHVLSQLDKESSKAKKILEDAKSGLAEEAQKAAGGLKDAVKGIGK